ncbi:hypothetical protein [Streptomyces sp. NPDC058249]|uniref:hypothetical protein n=1 Tax=Streptomyces sp. NPDC058249 TaxID=3346403 RepID=UPI0036E59C56
MSILGQALPNLLGELGAALLIILGTWFVGRRRARYRRYTLLGTVGTDGHPMQHATTRPPGTVIRVMVDGHRERFELTNVKVPDGTYAAEPMDLYV